MGPVVRAAFFLFLATVGLCLVHAADSSKDAETAPLGASAIVVEAPSREVQAHRRELKKTRVKSCGEGSGICPFSGVAGCSVPDVFCGGACCTDSAEYPCCGGVMCCKKGGCYQNKRGQWGCCPIGKKACGRKCC
ncbi:unnamed protein product [Closterium sp. Yama58-4]|nr:unnamed protein product [Closterium sp. Yama58-4]